MEQARVSALFLYPVKSMKGIAVQEATLTLRGLEHDRRWMVVRPDGRFVTQREEPRLALIRTQLDEQGVTLSRDGHGSISIPFAAAGGEPLQVGCGRTTARRWTKARGLTLAERRAGQDRKRPDWCAWRPASSARRASRNALARDTRTVFADAAPSRGQRSRSSLNRELQAQGHAPVPINRFRPNIVVRGLPPFSEHRAAALAGAGWSIALVDHCVRCLVTTVDQETARRDPAHEPYQTLRRLNPAPREKSPPAFAQNAKLGSGAGARIAVGAALTLSPASR
jgi:hypothetical protein